MKWRGTGWEAGLEAQSMNQKAVPVSSITMITLPVSFAEMCYTKRREISMLGMLVVTWKKLRSLL